MTGSRPGMGLLVKPAASLLAALLLVSTSAAALECPAAYPVDFPCLPGGTEFDFDSVRAFIPGASKSVALQYAGPPKDLHEKVIASATALGWTVESREEAQEVNETRYRAAFRKGERVVSISVFGNTRAALLLVVAH